MFKTELIRRVAAETRLSQRVVSDVINSSHRLIEQALREGKTVTIPGFGIFYTRERAEGQARDFRSGKMIRVLARRIAAFRAGAVLKRAVRGERKKRLQATQEAGRFRRVGDCGPWAPYRGRGYRLTRSITAAFAASKSKRSLGIAARSRSAPSRTWAISPGLGILTRLLSLCLSASS